MFVVYFKSMVLLHIAAFWVVINHASADTSFTNLPLCSETKYKIEFQTCRCKTTGMGLTLGEFSHFQNTICTPVPGPLCPAIINNKYNCFEPTNDVCVSNIPNNLDDNTPCNPYTPPPHVPGPFEEEVTNAKKYKAGTPLTGLKPKFCCNDFYIEPTRYSYYTDDLETNKKMSCSLPIETKKCGTIVPTRNSHIFGDSGGGVHCIESHSCLECLEHFQILCGPGYTWDGNRCEWLIDIPHAMKYDQGNDIKGSHGDTSCIVLDQNGYAIDTKYNNPNKDDCDSGYCYNARDNVGYNGQSSSMVGETELTLMGLTWVGQDTGTTRPPSIARPPTPPPNPPPPTTDWTHHYTPITTSVNGEIKTTGHTKLRELLASGFCCSRMFEPGIIGRPKEIFMEGKEFLPGHDTNSHMINMGIADGSLALGRRRRLAYEAAGEIPTFSEMFFGEHEGCGHAPPVDTDCGRVVDPHGLELQHKDLLHYMGGANCGGDHSPGANVCHDRVTSALTANGGFAGKKIPAHEFFDFHGGVYTDLAELSGGVYTDWDELRIQYESEGRNTLDIAMAAHGEEYVSKCDAEPGCGFHTDCTDLCHNDANWVYRNSNLCGNCGGGPGAYDYVPSSGTTTSCYKYFFGNSQPIWTGVMDEFHRCEKVETPDWNTDICTTTEQHATYRPPTSNEDVITQCWAEARRDTNIEGPDAINIYLNTDRCVNNDIDSFGGDPSFAHLWFMRNLTDNCMCSMDNQPKASIDNMQCHMCLDASVISCADGYSYDAQYDNCTAGGICLDAFSECHVQPEDQLFADPIPCLHVSGHNFGAGENAIQTDADICHSTNYTVPRACVWDKKKQKCKAGIYFGSYNASFQNTCDSINFQNLNEGPVQTEWNCESTIWNEKRSCQSSKRVAYPVECERKYGGDKIECDPARRVIPWSPDPDDICSVLYGHKNVSFLGPNLEKDTVMKTLMHLCEWPEKSFVEKLEDWLTNLSPMELVAFSFLGLPVVGTLVCMGNSIFRWNEGCLKKCCHRNFDKKSTWKRTQVANTVTAGRVIVVDPSQDSKKN